MGARNIVRLLGHALKAGDKFDLDTAGSFLPVVDDSTVNIGDGTNSIDLNLYGGAAANYISWDASANDLKFEDSVSLMFGTGATAGVGTAGDVELRWDGTDLDLLATTNNSIFKIGNGTSSFDVWLYGSAAANYVSWDASANDLKFEDSVSLMFGTGAGAGPGTAGDVELRWDGTDLDLLPAVDDSVFKIGTGVLSFDVWLYGSVAANYISWDASADDLKFEDNVSLMLGTGAVAGPGTAGDVELRWDGTDLDLLPTVDDSVFKIGTGVLSFDVWLYGSVAANYISWDASTDDLKFEDSVSLMLGSGAVAGPGTAGDVELRWDGTDLDLLATVDDSVFKIGNGTASFDVWLYGSVAANYISWDASADDLKFEDSVSLMLGSGAAAGPGTAGDVELRWDGTDLDLLATVDDSIFKIGNGTASFDVWLYGSVAASYISWDASADDLKFEDNVSIMLGTGAVAGPGTAGDVELRWDGTDLDLLATVDDSIFKIGNGTASFDVWLYGSVAANYISWDASADDLKFEDSVSLMFGSGAAAGPGTAGDVELRWDGTDLDLLATVDDSVFKIGNGTASFDVWLYGSVAANYISWDASADDLKFEDSVSLMFGTGAGAGPGNAGDVELRWDGTDLDLLPAVDDSIFKIGDGTLNFDAWLYGSAAANYVSWDASTNYLKFEDTVRLTLGTGAAAGPGTVGDVILGWDGTDLDLTCEVDDTIFKIGNGTASFDVWIYGDVAANYVLFDADKSEMLFTSGYRDASVRNIVTVEQDFLASSGATLPAPWATQDTSAAGTPTINYVNDGANGEFELTHDATSEAQNLTLYWGDSQHIDPTKKPIFEARLKVNFAGATFSADQRVVIGLASARNATLDNVVSNVWFRIEGANLNILKEGDDGTTDTDDIDSTIDIVDNTFTVFKIDMSDLAAVKFYVDGVLAGGAAIAVSALAAANVLQPFIEIQRDAGTEAESVVIDYVRVDWNR